MKVEKKQRVTNKIKHKNCNYNNGMWDDQESVIREWAKSTITEGFTMVTLFKCEMINREIKKIYIKKTPTEPNLGGSFLLLITN